MLCSCLCSLPPVPQGACLANACELFPASVNEVDTFSVAVLCDSIRDFMAAFSPLPKMSIKSQKKRMEANEAVCASRFRRNREK